MKTNTLPKYDMNNKPTGCCPKFDPKNWDDQKLRFKDKPFVRVKTKSFFHIPLNIGSVFPKTFETIMKENAFSEDDFIILSHDPSPWTGEHFFSVTKEIPVLETIKMTGNFITKVFEGPFKDAPKWEKEMERTVRDKGLKIRKTYYFYTTCPKCAKVYGKNYVVAVSETE